MCWLQPVQGDGLRIARGPNDGKKLGVSAVDLEGAIVGWLKWPANCISAHKDVSALVQLSIDVRLAVGVVTGLQVLGLNPLHGGAQP